MSCSSIASSWSRRSSRRLRRGEWPVAVGRRWRLSCLQAKQLGVESRLGSSSSWSPPVAETASVHQLRPVRVLVAGADPEFVERATFELAAFGFDVMSTTAVESTVELALLQRVNVVLLDASRGVAAAAATAS